MKALSIHNLKKKYANGFEALKGINLEVEEGDFFALLGPNGAGKSTLIGIISSLVTKSSGQVSLFGYDIERSADQAKSCIGLVPQETNFNQFETVENILLNQAGYYGISRKQAKAQTEQCLKQMDLWEKRTTVSRRLSGGMKRRLMIARAMVHQPRLLILDEPTAGVDIEIRRSMWELMERLNREGTSIILTTHYLEEAESLCRNIAIIDGGEITEQSSMQSLLSKIQRESFILDIADELVTTPIVKGYDIDRLDAKTLLVAVDKSQGLNPLFNELSEQGVTVLSMKNKSNRLEQLFMDLVR